MNTVEESPTSAKPGALRAEPAFFGPFCLSSVAVWLATVAVWNLGLEKPVETAVIEQYTETGRKFFRPEFDLPIYLAGLGGAVLGGVIYGLCWRRRWVAAASDAARARIERWSDRHFVWAVGCLAFALIAPENPTFNLLTSAIAVGSGLAIWARSTASAGAAPSKAVTPAASEAKAVASSNDSSSTKEAAAVAAEPAADLPAPIKRHSTSRLGGWLAAAVAACIIAMLVYVPDTTPIESHSWVLDGFMHWNFYLMAPLLAFRHGAALGTEFYSQYSVGWPLFFSVLGRFWPIDFAMVFTTVTLLACLYFFGLYLFLRSLTGRWSWALAGLLLSLFLQMYCGTQGPLWSYPSSTILRNPFDVFLFWMCLFHARTGDPRYGIGIGLAAGLAVLFGTDTGIYTTAALVFYGLLCLRYRPDGRSALSGPFALATVGAFVATSFAGLAWASRGTLFRREFWLGYWESLFFYSGGISAIPMREGMTQYADFILMIVVLTAYTFALASAVLRWFTRQLEAADLVYALIAAFGLQTLMVFINRSHPFNLYHPIIPFCILVIAWGARWSEIAKRVRSPGAARQPRPSVLRRRAPAIAIALLLVGFTVNWNVLDYPSYGARLLAAVGSKRINRPPENVDYKADLEELLQIFKSVSEGGQHSVALIDPEDTNIHTLADVPPYFRYSPMDPLHYRQIEIIRKKLVENPPEVILIAFDAPRELTALEPELLRDLYTVEKTHRLWKVLRRNDGAPANTSRVDPARSE